MIGDVEIDAAFESANRRRRGVRAQYRRKGEGDVIGHPNAPLAVALGGEDAGDLGAVCIREVRTAAVDRCRRVGDAADGQMKEIAAAVGGVVVVQVGMNMPAEGVDLDGVVEDQDADAGAGVRRAGARIPHGQNVEVNAAGVAQMPLACEQRVRGSRHGRRTPRPPNNRKSSRLAEPSTADGPQDDRTT